MTADLSRYSELAWAQLWQVTVVALFALLIVRLGCRRRPHLAYAVLLVAIVKCLTPPVVSSPTGVFSWSPPATSAISRDGDWSEVSEDAPSETTAAETHEAASGHFVGPDSSRRLPAPTSIATTTDELVVDDRSLNAK